ncbi:MAG: T9SS type A sorting domain-containing protein, partial [Flavobacteriaceae bacterium]|nr:T9SS type A sorting domain-containing protein [Flavobacteriaceae bacterium]
AQNTLGTLLNTENSFDGYILFSPRTSEPDRNTYLINNCGEVINQWSSTFRVFSTDYLMPDGSLFRSVIDNQSTLDIPGNTGRIEHLDWDGNTIWALTYADTDYSFHHDYVVLDNGNILMLVAKRRTFQEAIDNGRDPATIAQNELYEECVLEIEPVGTDGFNIVWEWNSWDHLIQDFDNTKLNFGVVGDHPELVDINFGTNFGEADWWHSNALSYSPELDQIIISNRNSNEFLIIDHSTTTAEAAVSTGGNSGMGGDIIYRYGNPQSYDQGDESDRKLFAQHDVQFIPPGSPNAGKIMMFNNGQGLGYTRIQIITPPYDALNQNYTYTGGAYEPNTVDWEYVDPDDPTNFFAAFLSGAQELPNGNFLICHGPDGLLFEVDPGSNTVWSYQSPVANTGILTDGVDPITGQTRIFRALKYPPDYPGLDGKDLTPGTVIELDPAEDNCVLLSTSDFASNTGISIHPTVVENYLNINTDLTAFEVRLFSISGQLIKSEKSSTFLDLSSLNSGLYFVQISDGTSNSTFKIIKN